MQNSFKEKSLVDTTGSVTNQKHHVKLDLHGNYEVTAFKQNVLFPFEPLPKDLEQFWIHESIYLTITL